MFDAETCTNKLIAWIQDYYSQFEDITKAVIFISGGCDSTVAAKLLCEALGPENVVGLSTIYPQQSDNADVDLVYSELGILRRVNVDPNRLYRYLHRHNVYAPLSIMYRDKVAPSFRYDLLLEVADENNGKICGFQDLSDIYICWNTDFTECAGQYYLFSKLTRTEVRAIGTYLDLPDAILNKVPYDYWMARDDEEKFKFSYTVLDTYIREGTCADADVKMKIDSMHSVAGTWTTDIPVFDPSWEPETA